jgi:glycogen operon protein
MLMRKHGTEPGSPLTLGAYPTGAGVQFSLFSRHATELHLLLFNTPGDTTPDEVFVLDPKLNKTGDVWHIHVHGLKAGQLYLYRVDGPHEPGKGHRFDFDAWLIDPYARALTNATPWFEWKRDLMPKCVVIDPEFDWEGDKPLNYPLKDCVIYETHLAGLTRHPSAKVSSKGTYQGVVELIPYFKQLGITSLEFLPVQEFNPHDVFRLNPDLGKGLKNYWGYNTVAFFAPASQYARNTDQGGQVVEFKAMVKALHQAGIEVILDIVFNHTAEGNEMGPTYSFRGLDNSIYYILDETKEGYRNYSGCGNTLNCNHPIVRSLIITCIRYWVLEMHVDGFRFDLGSILGRDSNGMLLSNPPIIEMLAEDPVLRNTKLIAEAWDAAGSYQVGSFHGERWAEWNDRYRDDVRRFWANDPRMISALAMRLSGSSDLYSTNGRKPFHSINFITSHDGFTLNDLVSYEKKHNLANGEENADGHNANFSRNHGVEGPSQSKDIENLRNRMVRNFLATLLLSAGTPMLLGGDEFRRTQQGNNNAYCQDNEISWFDWTFADTHADILRFYRELVLFRIRHQVFKRAEFFSGTDANDNGVSDITWLDETGKPIDWSSTRNLLAVLIDGHRTETKADKDDNDFLLMFNSGNQDMPFLLPMSPCGSLWHLKIDTAGVVDIYPKGESKLLTDQRIYWVSARSMVVLVAALVHDNS